MTILLPINPEYVEKIFTGEKRYEYRKIKPRKAVTTILVYETYPTMKVVGEAEILDIVVDTPPNVWKQTCVTGGITKDYFDKYYKDKTQAVAYKLGTVKRYEKAIELSEYGINYIPQNYIYIK